MFLVSFWCARSKHTNPSRAKLVKQMMQVSKMTKQFAYLKNRSHISEYIQSNRIKIEKAKHYGWLS